MENKCLKKFAKLKKDIDEFQRVEDKVYEGEWSHYKFEFLFQHCHLKEYMDEIGVMDLLKEELSNFFNLYDKEYMKENFYLKQLEVKDCPFLKVLENFYYILACYLGNEKLYRDFPNFMKALVDNYKLPGYENLTYKDYYYGFLQYNFMKYSENYDDKYERVLIDYKTPYANNSYDSFEEEMRKELPNYNKDGVFWRWAERDTFLKEKDYIKSKVVYDTNKIVRWVSRFDGDGYGYDILSYDPEKKREKLIEVKTTECERFFISNEEVRKAYETSKSNYCDYYIYGYIRQSNNIPLLKKLKFDKEKYYFINIDDPEDIYYISGDIFPKNNEEEDKYNGKVQLYIESKERFNYLKNRDIPVFQK